MADETQPIVGILHAKVPPEREGELAGAFAANMGEVAPYVSECQLLRCINEDHMWRIQIIWRSGKELQRYRSSVDVPADMATFRSVDADGFGIALHEVAARA